jgi:hypothetical protein
MGIPTPVPMVIAGSPPLAECPVKMHPSVAQRQQREFKAVQDLGSQSHSSMEVPPSQLDQQAKAFQQAAVWAVKLSNKRTALVSSDQAENGLELFSNELQQSQTTELGNDDGADTHLTATTAKKHRAAIQPATTVPAPIPIPPSGRHTSYSYNSKEAQSGNPEHGIIHYCDTGKKGFYAPDDDTLKLSMECGLVLCLPCFEKRRLECEKETGAAKGGRRIGRRSKKC